MKSTLERPGIDRRQDPRCPTHADAHLRKQDLLPSAEWPAVIEESGACGLRLRTQALLHPGEVIFLRVPGELLPLHAHVVWAKADDPSHRGGSHSWTSGCRLDGASIGRLKLAAIPEAASSRRGGFGRWTLMVLGGVGILAVVTYAFIRLAMLIGGGANLWRFR